MPYIKEEMRQWWDTYLVTMMEGLEHRDLEKDKMTAGELNYIISSIALKFVRVKGESYQNYNDMIGALECAKTELYRRFIAPYEDLKVKENGDLDP